MSELKTYHVGNISIDAEGRFHIHFAGLPHGSPGEDMSEIRPLHGYGKNLAAFIGPIVTNLQKTSDLFIQMIENLPDEDENDRNGSN